MKYQVFFYLEQGVVFKFGEGEHCPCVCDWLTYTKILKCKLHDVWKPMFSIYI
jgi:hypothetical protein